jgi:HK97 family phage portal protein
VVSIKSYFSQIYRAIKAIPFNGEGGSGMLWPSYWGPYVNTRINYAQEVGPLTSSSLIMAAVNWLGTTLPEAPVEVLERKSNKVWETIDDHPMVDLVDRPNPYHSGELLWKAWSLSWLIDGNAYFIKVRNNAGEVIQLWYEPHFTIRARWPLDGSEFISFYEIERNGQWYRVEAQDVIHFRYGIDPCNVRLGLSPVASVLREIFTDHERARYSALILRNGGVVPFLLTPDPSASQTELDPAEIKHEWEYRTTGDNVGRPMVLNGPVKVQTIGQPPDNLLVDKASTIPEERIAAVIGIPAAVLGFGVGLEQTKVGATMRELREQAYESFVIPTQRIIAGELRNQLLPEFDDSPSLKVSHDLTQVRVLQEDHLSLIQRECLAYEKDIKTRAEVRSALGLETTPEDEMYFSQWKQSLIPQLGPQEQNPPQLRNGRDQQEMVN